MCVFFFSRARSFARFILIYWAAADKPVWYKRINRHRQQIIVSNNTINGNGIRVNNGIFIIGIFHNVKWLFFSLLICSSFCHTNTKFKLRTTLVPSFLFYKIIWLHSYLFFSPLYFFFSNFPLSSIFPGTILITIKMKKKKENRNYYPFAADLIDMKSNHFAEHKHTFHKWNGVNFHNNHIIHSNWWLSRN